MKIEKLIPPLKDYLWGGNKLKTEYGKFSDKTIVAESWELSFHKDGKTMLENGKALADSVTDADIGSNCAEFEFFPTLTKFIDAKDNLSIQVHPSDAYALSNENSYGKTEMWYIVEATENAGIYLGLNKTLTPEQFADEIKQGTLTSVLNFIPVKKGDYYFIPSGTIHAIGAGCLIYEIQQNSNLTYRVYDYNRKDAKGNTRELHIDKAKKVTNLNKFIPIKINTRTAKGNILGISKYFTASILNLNAQTTLSTYNSFCCITCMDGHAIIDNVSICKGESVFVPASYGSYTLEGNATLILTEVRKYYVKVFADKIEIIDDEENLILSKQCKTITDAVISDTLKDLNMTINDVKSIIRI